MNRNDSIGQPGRGTLFGGEHRRWHVLALGLIACVYLAAAVPSVLYHPDVHGDEWEYLDAAANVYHGRGVSSSVLYHYRWTRGAVQHPNEVARPLPPLIIAAAFRLTGGPTLLVGRLVSLFAGAAALFVVFVIIRPRAGAAPATVACLALCFSAPWITYCGLTYTEVIYSLVLLVCFWAVTRVVLPLSGRGMVALAVPFLLLSLTRSNGLFGSVCLLPVLLDRSRLRSSLRKAAVYVVILISLTAVLIRALSYFSTREGYAPGESMATTYLKMLLTPSGEEDPRLFRPRIPPSDEPTVKERLDAAAARPVSFGLDLARRYVVGSVRVLGWLVEGEWWLAGLFLLAVPGWRLRVGRAEGWAAAVIAIHVLFFAPVTVSMNDVGPARYMVPYLPLLAVVLGGRTGVLLQSKRRRGAAVVVGGGMFLLLLTARIGNPYQALRVSKHRFLAYQRARLRRRDLINDINRITAADDVIMTFPNVYRLAYAYNLPTVVIPEDAGGYVWKLARSTRVSVLILENTIFISPWGFDRRPFLQEHWGFKDGNWIVKDPPPFLSLIKSTPTHIFYRLHLPEQDGPT